MNKKVLILIIVAIVIIGIIIAGICIKNNIEKDLETLKHVQITDIDLNQVNDGIYKGSYKQMPVAAEVKVTVKDHKITDIDLVKHEHGQGSAAEIIPDMVIDKQSLDVESISGATYSSKVILKAIENALKIGLK